MSESMKALGGLTAHEWRRFRRSPVWMIGLLATAWFMLNEGRSSVGWPPVNTSLNGFQLAVSVLLGIISFLLAAGSLARDLDYPRSELVFSRPIPIAIYLGGKFLGTVFFVLALLGILLLISLVRPFFHGVMTVYPPKPFLLVVVLCGIPLVIYTCALGTFLTALTGRVIVALPLFLLYFFWAAILRSHSQVDLLDFTMRLYPRNMTIDVPIHLTDYSFSDLLSPVEPLLVGRCALYLALSAVLLAGAWWILGKRSESRWGIVGQRPRTRFFRWRHRSTTEADTEAQPETKGG